MKYKFQCQLFANGDYIIPDENNDEDYELYYGTSILKNNYYRQNEQNTINAINFLINKLNELGFNVLSHNIMFFDEQHGYVSLEFISMNFIHDPKLQYNIMDSIYINGFRTFDNNIQPLDNIHNSIEITFMEIIN